MKWSFRVATVAGIQVRIHATFVLLLGLYTWIFYIQGADPDRDGVFSVQGGIETARNGVIFLLLLFLCVLLHEFGHAFAARAFGIRTPDITLLPIGGIARLEKLPTSPWQEFIIAVAGPAVNVVIVLLLLIDTRALPSFREIGALDLGGGQLAMNLMRLNCALILFNMIPAFPMDGGRVLRALLATRLRHSLATLVAARVGQGIAVLFVVRGLFMEGNPVLFIIGFFVFMGAQQELIYAQMRESARRYKVGEIMKDRYTTLPDSLPLSEISTLLLGSNQDIFPVVGENLDFRGFSDREALLDAARRLPPETAVSETAKMTELLHTDTGLEEALEMMQKLQQPLLPVVNGSGQLVGLVDIDQLLDLSRKGPNN